LTERHGPAPRSLACLAAALLVLWPSSLARAALPAVSVAQRAVRPVRAASVSGANCGPFAPPAGNLVNVSTVAGLEAAISSLTPNTTILIADGTYNLTQFLKIDASAHNVTIRGASGNRDAVILSGGGMTNNGTNLSHIFQVFAPDVTIADLTLRDVYYHPVQIHGEAGATRPTLYNLHLVNAGQQFVKVSVAPNPSPYSDDGLVACSTIEYTNYPPSDYTNGVDVLAGAGWVIRDNVFRNIRSPDGSLAGPAVLMWRNSLDTLVERNLFIECDRAIALGLSTPDSNSRDGETTYDHQGGIVRNNFIYRAGPGDVGITLNYARNAEVYNNTVLLNGTFAYGAIEYRFSAASADIRYNLTDAPIWLRDGASGAVSGNVTNALPGWFANAAAGNLHLLPSATAAIDQAASLAAVPDDYDGAARPIGPAPDVGADEYGVAPPGAVLDLRLTNVIAASNVLTGTLVWTAPGNALTTTLRCSTGPITPANWPAATPLGGSLPGATQQLSATVPYTGGKLYFALKSANAGGESPLSNLAFWPMNKLVLPLIRR
jgi:hypothetical protein